MRIGFSSKEKNKLLLRSNNLLKKQKPEKYFTKSKINNDFKYYFIWEHFFNGITKNQSFNSVSVKCTDLNDNFEKKYKIKKFHLIIPPNTPFFMLLLNLWIVSVNLFVLRDWYIALSIFIINYCYVFILFSLSLSRINIILSPFQDFCFN